MTACVFQKNPPGHLQEDPQPTFLERLHLLRRLDEDEDEDMDICVSPIAEMSLVGQAGQALVSSK